MDRFFDSTPDRRIMAGNRDISHEEILTDPTGIPVHEISKDGR